MRPSVRGSRVVAILLLLLAFALAALAGLQYRWIDRITESDRIRQQEAAAFVARRIAGQLRDEIRRTFDAFLDAEDADAVPMYDRWLRGAPWPDLIAAVYVAERFDTEWRLFRLNAREEQFDEVPWPAELAPMRAPLQTLEPRSPRPNWPKPLVASLPGMFIVQRPPSFEPDYLHTVPHRVILVQFSREALSRSVMPALQTSEGSESAVDVSLISGGTVLYRSDPTWQGGESTADVSAIIPASVENEGPPGDRRRGGPPLHEKAKRKGPPPRPGDWQVLVRHRAGGLEQLVAQTRRRNLAVSGGILAILAAGMAMLVVLMRRAERLRAQEAAFVSVMSHELNTPVAVLRSAGENLKDGIVDGDQVPVYGDTIVQEADRLRHMIAAVQELAGMQARTEARPLRSIAVAPIVEAAVARCRLLANGAVQLDADIEPNLPPVAADDEALRRAIQNLIVNAMRHGASGGWVGVRVRREGKRVNITVEDRGPGIHADDLDQIFEPFYRGKDSANVSGAGLGLTIVKQIAIDHGGTVTFDRRDTGAAFTIHLPAEARGA